MLDVLLIMTRKCNLKCEHCCDDCGPKEAAKAMGIYNPKDEFMYRRNPCVMCEEIFRGMR